MIYSFAYLIVDAAGFALGLRLLVSGVRDGLMRKKMLVNKQEQRFVDGRDAIERGCIFVVGGLFFLACSGFILVQGVRYNHLSFGG